MKWFTKDQYGLPVIPHAYQNFLRLYKYTKKEFADAMLRKGTFRVGTLYEYQKMEAAEIGDCDEGKKCYSIDESNRSEAFQIITDHDPAVAIRLRTALANHDAAEENVILGIINMAPDSYLFSTTKVVDEEVMRKFGYDACIEISKPDRFFKSLCKAMHPYAIRGILGACVYQNRWNSLEMQSPVLGDLMKGTEFSHQQEVRALWEPIDGVKRGADSELTAKIINAPEASRYCRRIL